MLCCLLWLTSSVTVTITNECTDTTIYLRDSAISSGFPDSVAPGKTGTFYYKNQMYNYRIVNSKCPLDSPINQVNTIGFGSRTFTDKDLEEYNDGKCKAGITQGVIKYSILSDTEVVVSGIDCKAQTNIEIPDTVDKYKVVEIADEAFLTDQSVKGSKIRPCCPDFKGSLTLGDNIKKIGLRAFVLNAFSEIKLPRNLETIGDEAFSNSIFLTEISIPGTVKSIGESAFDGCAELTTLNLANGVTSIGKLAFLGCPIQDLVIPDSVTTILEYAFAIGPGGTLTLPSNLQTIEKSAFSYTGFTGEIILPASLTSIGKDAFTNLETEPTFKFLGSSDVKFSSPVFDQKKVSKIYVTESYTGETFCGVNVERLTVERSIVVQIDSSLDGFTILYQKDGNGGKVEIPSDKTIKDTKDFTVQFYVTNSNYDQCTEIPLGNSISVNGENQRTSLSRDMISEGSCVSKQEFLVKLKNGLDSTVYTVKYTSTLHPDDPPEDFVGTLTLSSNVAFEVNLYITTTLPDCPTTELTIKSYTSDKIQTIVETDLPERCQQKEQPNPSTDEDDKPNPPEEVNYVDGCVGSKCEVPTSLSQISNEYKNKNIRSLYIELYDDANLDELDVAVTKKLYISIKEGKVTGKVTCKNVDTEISIWGDEKVLSNIAVEMKSSGKLVEIKGLPEKIPLANFQYPIKELTIDYGSYVKKGDIVTAYFLPSPNAIETVNLKISDGVFTSKVHEKVKATYTNVEAKKLRKAMLRHKGGKMAIKEGGNEEENISEIYLYKYKIGENKSKIEEGSKSNVGLIVGVVVAVVVVIVIIVVVVFVVLKKKKKNDSSSSK